MNKFFSLETKGEIVAILKHNEMSYMDFVKTCKEIEEREGAPGRGRLFSVIEMCGP